MQLGRVSVGTPWLARLPSLSASFFNCRSKLSMANSSQGSGGAVLVSHCLIALRLSPRREASSPCVHLAFSLKCVSRSLTLMMQLIHHNPATASQDCHVSSLLNARVHFVHHPTLPSEPTGNRSVRSRVSQEARVPHSLLTCRVRVRFGRSPPALRQVNAKGLLREVQAAEEGVEAGVGAQATATAQTGSVSPQGEIINCTASAPAAKSPQQQQI